MKRMRGLTAVYILVAIIQLALFYYLFLGGDAVLKKADIIQMAVLGIFIGACYIAIVFIIQRIVKNRQMQNEEEKRLLKEKYEEDYYLLTQEQSKKINEIKREMRESLDEIERLLETEGNEKGNRKELEERLNEAEDRVNQFGSVYYCSDSVLNALLAVKQERAISLGIDMDIMVRSIVKTDVSDMDMCSIVTNLLDNAIEAVQKVREAREFEGSLKEGSREMAEEKADDIIVRIGRQARYFVIRVKNRMIEAPRKSAKGGFISSKKEAYEEKMHGRGSRIVETLVEKYGGYMDVLVEEEWMIVTVFLEEREEGDE